MDPLGTAHVSYADTLSSLVHRSRPAGATTWAGGVFLKGSATTANWSAIPKWVQMGPSLTTWIGLDTSGSPNIGWTTTGYNQLYEGVGLARRVANAWTHQVSYLPSLKPVGPQVPQMNGVSAYRAAFDTAGRPYHAWIGGEQTVAPAQPRAHLQVTTPSFCTIVTSTHGWLRLLDLAVENSGRLHLLYSAADPKDQAPRLLLATSDKGGAWSLEELTWTSAMPDGVLHHAALALDQDGAPHVALSAYPRNTKPTEQTLVVGTRVKDQWSFSVVSQGLPFGSHGAFDLVAERSVSYLAYFDSEALKVSRICH